MVLSEDWSLCTTKSIGEWTTTIAPSVHKCVAAPEFLGA